jgi:hypothetical protein
MHDKQLTCHQGNNVIATITIKHVCIVRYQIHAQQRLVFIQECLTTPAILWEQIGIMPPDHGACPGITARQPNKRGAPDEMVL